MPAIKFAATAVAVLLSAAVPASGLSNDAQMCLVQFVRYNLLRQPFPSKRIFIKLGKRVTLFCVLWLLTVSKPISALDCKIASSIRRNAIVSNDQRCFWGNLPSNVDDTITVVHFVSWLNPPSFPPPFYFLCIENTGWTDGEIRTSKCWSFPPGMQSHIHSSNTRSNAMVCQQMLFLAGHL